MAASIGRLPSRPLILVKPGGTVQTGKLADLVAVTGNPLDDMKALEHVDFVMIGGRVAKTPNGGETLAGILPAPH